MDIVSFLQGVGDETGDGDVRHLVLQGVAAEHRGERGAGELLDGVVDKDAVGACDGDRLSACLPEGGSGGGTVIATGTPEDVAANPVSYTGSYLAPMLGVERIEQSTLE